jgi:membrane-bound lytic murein transglycosylase MltF
MPTFTFSRTLRRILLNLFVCVAICPTAWSANIEENLDLGIEIDEQAVAEFQTLINSAHKDDLYAMLERGTIRVGVTYNKTHYFLYNGQPYGLAYEGLRAFENYLRKRFKTKLKRNPLKLIPVPMARDQLMPRLEAGLIDLAVANLTITPLRKTFADFSIPTLKNASEILVSSRGAPKPSSLEFLSGKSIVVRKSSSFYEHLLPQNEALLNAGLAPIKIIPANEFLEVEDLLELTNQGVIDYTVADLHVAKLWAKIYQDIRVHNEIKISDNTNIAWAIRKNTPEFMSEVNRFLKKHRSGTTFGNVLKKRYLENTAWAKKAMAQQTHQRYGELLTLFENYGAQYSLNHLMLFAQAYQESRLDNTKTSHVGAIGIMQIMPRTGRAMGFEDLHVLENNIHAGSKYLRHIIERYFDDPNISELDKTLFAIASYNAGPSRISRLRKTTAKLGLDPNIWYGNVENVVSRYVGQEPVTYVANISKYYITYELIEELNDARTEVKDKIEYE